MNTKPDYFPSLEKSGEHCNHLDASPWQGAVQVPIQPLTSPGVLRMWGNIPAPDISHSHLSNLQMDSGFSKSKYCQKFTSCHCMP